MATIDRGKLGVRIRHLSRPELLAVLDRALAQVPKRKLAEIAAGYVKLDGLEPDPREPGRVLAAMMSFRESSLRGDYHEAFNVDSKNYTETSPGTERWNAECERLCAQCVELAKKKSGQVEAREAIEVLIGILRRIDEGMDDVVFFADEGGVWSLDVPWDELLPAWFTTLTTTATTEEFARFILCIVDEFVSFDRVRYFTKARAIGTAEQVRALDDALRSSARSAL